jgi:radical SAM superfamily enzyme YgiQ (UPF0313 family)
MKILLINPPYENVVQWYPPDTNLTIDKFGTFPALGLLYIAGYLEKYSNHEVFVLDCPAENISYGALEEKLRQIRPDIVAVTSFTISLIDVVKTARLAKSIVPKAHITLGGHHAMAFPEESVSLDCFDSVMVGEGEKMFFELAAAIEKGLPIENIFGVCTKKNIKERLNKTAPDGRFLPTYPVTPAYIENIDELPFPSRKHISHLKFFNITGKSNKLATLITSRGCPYKCAYCEMPYKQYRPRSLESVADEIEECLHMGYEEFHFYDDTFNITPERTIEFANIIKRRGLKFVWDFRGRVNTVTEESLKALKSVGLRLISFGVEAATNEGLEYINKALTVEKIKEVFAMCRKLKIETVANFIIGFPFEKNEADINKNINFAVSLDPTYIMFSVLTLNPHTRLYNEAIEKGLIDPQKYINFAKNPQSGFSVDHWTEFFTKEQLYKFHKKAYLKFYLRPAYAWRQVKSLSSWEEFKIKFKGFLALLKII